MSQPLANSRRSFLKKSTLTDKRIMQNQVTKGGWKSIITWMQQTQNLWPLGVNKGPILNYLAKNYAPEPTGRRKPLENIQWYELNN